MNVGNFTYFNNDPINYNQLAKRNAKINRLNREIKQQRNTYQKFINTMHEGAGYQFANKLASNYLRRNIIKYDINPLDMKWMNIKEVNKALSKLNEMKLEFNFSLGKY